MPPPGGSGFTCNAMHWTGPFASNDMQGYDDSSCSGAGRHPFCSLDPSFLRDSATSHDVWPEATGVAGGRWCRIEENPRRRALVAPHTLTARPFETFVCVAFAQAQAHARCARRRPQGARAAPPAAAAAGSAWSPALAQTSHVEMSLELPCWPRPWSCCLVSARCVRQLNTISGRRIDSAEAAATSTSSLQAARWPGPPASTTSPLHSTTSSAPLPTTRGRCVCGCKSSILHAAASACPKRLLRHAAQPLLC